MATLVFVHAHPDDEALLTAGTMARASAEGQRVVLVVATDGAAGLASSAYGAGADLAATRRRELDASARALGVHRVVRLDYGDSGLTGDVAGNTLCAADLGVVAGDIAAVLREEQADVLVTYDPAGGYGHPDHVRSREAALGAARDVALQTVFEATLPREPLARAVGLAALVYRFPAEFDPSSYRRGYTPRSLITHRVDVRDHLAAKRASMAAHASQASADDGARTLAAILRLPRPFFSALFGTEYYRRITARDPD